MSGVVDAAQLVRDLLWVVNSPSFCEGPDVAPELPLLACDIDEAALHRFMSSRHEHRVGRYFEQLLLYWLAEVRGVDMVGNGIQLRDGKRTIGEIDFLYRDEAGDLVHCEASVKFFLHHPRPATSHFPGPNATDNYELKTTKLFDQQLQISREHYPDVTKRHGFVKGMIFYHDDIAAPTEWPARLPANHLRGRWLRESELDQLAPTGDLKGLVANKPLWLAAQSAAHAESCEQLQATLKAHFADKGHPVMVSLFDAGGDIEVERLFVVPDYWPG